MWVLKTNEEYRKDCQRRRSSLSSPLAITTVFFATGFVVEILGISSLYPHKPLIGGDLLMAIGVLALISMVLFLGLFILQWNNLFPMKYRSSVLICTKCGKLCEPQAQCQCGGPCIPMDRAKWIESSEPAMKGSIQG